MRDTGEICGEEKGGDRGRKDGRKKGDRHALIMHDGGCKKRREGSICEMEKKGEERRLNGATVRSLRELR